MTTRPLPLAGIRVTDFTWMGAGPFATKPLADHGADVIKIESMAKPDLTRLAPPFAGGRPGVNRSGYFANRNSSKSSISLNMKTPQGRDLARRLIARSDVVINNFRPGAMARWGLDYQAVASLRPDIIYVDMPADGTEGPRTGYGGFGASIAALCGLHELSGDPDRLPVGSGTNYPDHILNPLHTATAVIAALYHRRRTGQGQYIEVAQFESSVNAVATALLAYTVTGRAARRQGNRDGQHAPRAVLRCVGPDRWCAISVRGQAGWAALCQAAGHPEWLDDARFADASRRLAHQDELEATLETWTSGLDRYDVMAACQAAGVPAGVVQTTQDLIDRDPALRARHWSYLDHPEMGRSLYDAPPFKLSRTPGGLRRPAPLLGADTDRVLRTDLGLSDAEIDGYRQAGVLA
jgi:benzylsuccinate CoA-transferase BbsF subunit